MRNENQSALGKELNRIMLETGMSPTQTMNMVMEKGAMNVGAHTFIGQSRAVSMQDVNEALYRLMDRYEKALEEIFRTCESADMVSGKKIKSIAIKGLAGE